MKALVLCADYPRNGGTRALYFAHVRNKYYQKQGTEVTVLNFAITQGYDYDGIRVISLSEYERENKKYDVLISHAPNIRNHYRFIQKFGTSFSKKVFIFHGHEILHINKFYPKPYAYMNKDSSLKRKMKNRYDNFKLRIWRKYYLKNIDNIRLIFVSEWLKNTFLQELDIEESQLKGNVVVISNSIGKFFEENSYEMTKPEYDFITIRSNLDESVYCIDLLRKVALAHPEKQFCLVGRGEFFKHFEKPQNIFWIDKVMPHEEMKKYMNASRYALMFTRHDSQGLMSCELATFGIPLITSDIPITRSVFSDCPNLAFIKNDKLDLEKAVKTIEEYRTAQKWDRYFEVNTVKNELEYIKFYVEN